MLTDAVVAVELAERLKVDYRHSLEACSGKVTKFGGKQVCSEV
jgi:hypothetical protein